MRNTTLAALMVGGALLIGCDNSDSKTATPPPAAPAAPAANSPTTPAMQDMAKKTSDTASDASKQMSDAASKAGASASDAVNASNASTKLTEVMNYIKDNKLDLAEKGLTELEKIKSSLPEQVQSGITAARTQLNTMKASSGGDAGDACDPEVDRDD